MSRQQYARRAKRSRTVVEVASESEEDSTIPVVMIDDSSPSASPSEDEDVKTKRKSRRKSSKKEKPKSPGVKLAPIFLTRKEREKPREKPPMSEATKNFLYSGVPDVIARTQKAIEKKKVEMDALDSCDIFPTYTHNIPIELVRSSGPVDFSKSPFTVTHEEPMGNLETKIGIVTRSPSEREDEVSALRLGEFCCGVNNNQPSRRLLKIMTRVSSGKDVDPLPWTEKHKLKRHHSLVVQADSQKKFKGWLKEWRRDIRDDGGTSRKVAKKRKKGRDSDSDFIEDEEGDPEMKNKSVILAGPTGSGKSAMVQVMAKRFGFKVVEVNFSSRRSGQEVLRRVEEATLSRRLSTGAGVDDKHCLLLFKDIDQVFLEEDEGFQSAVAQLISASLRPIVMTLTATHADPPIDPRIDKQNPLYIPIGIPSPHLITTNVLLPIIQQELEIHDPTFDFDEETQDREFMKRILNSIVGHCESDIKKSINQTQLLWYTRPLTLRHVHMTFAQQLDINYVTPVDTHLPPPPSAQLSKKVKQAVMDEIARNFEFLTDMDRVVKKRLSIPEEENLPIDLHSYFESNFYGMLDESINQRKLESEGSNGNNNNIVDLFRSLTFHNDKTMEDWKKSDGVYDQVVSKLDKMGNQEDYDEVAYFRSILKNGVINSIGQPRRKARMKDHFHILMGRDLIDSICDNLDFEKRLTSANEVGMVDVN